MNNCEVDILSFTKTCQLKTEYTTCMDCKACKIYIVHLSFFITNTTIMQPS